MRIAGALTFLAAAFLLITLCVRSYLTKDILWVRWSNSKSIRLASVKGRLVASTKSFAYPSPLVLKHTSPESLGTGYPDASGRYPNSYWPQIMRWASGNAEVHIPFWIPAAACGLLAALTAVKRRFSLRSLLIAMTLIAVLLGAVVALS
jgi:hypothetical protein